MAIATAERTKRLREVYDNDMVAHIWANQSQECARNATKNFYFSGTTIYSYGGHFPIANIVTRKGKGQCVLFTTKKYSATTAGHKSQVIRALRGSDTVFSVLDVVSRNTLNHGANLNDYAERIKSAATAAMRARANKDHCLNNALSLINEANDYAKFFGLRRKFQLPSELDLKAERKKAAQVAAAEKAKKEAARATLFLLAQADLQLWLNGALYCDQRLHCLEDTYLRVKPTCGTPEANEPAVLETSRGGEVPLAHAIRLLPLIRGGRGYKHNGHSERVGHFTVDEIDTEGNVKIGCHYVKRAEIERLAAQLGV